MHARILDGLTAPAQAALGKDYVAPKLSQFEGVAWPLATQRPPHLLSRRFANWDALFEDAAKDVRDELRQHGPLPQRRWGERNTAAICHPLVRALPFAKRLLCMPADQLPGDTAIPLDGVYAGHLFCAGYGHRHDDRSAGYPDARWPAAISIGVNPTFEGGKRSDVGVRNGEHGKYVQTHADGQWNNNLLSLIECVG